MTSPPSVSDEKLKVSAPAPPARISAPPRPARILLAAFPVMTLASPLPVPLMADAPVSVRFSISPLAWRASERLKVMEDWTVSVPSPPVSSATSPALSIT